MRDEDRGVHLDADLKASKTFPKSAALTWPLPADRRLDQLVELANEVGAGTRRNEMAAQRQLPAKIPIQTSCSGWSCAGGERSLPTW